MQLKELLRQLREGESVGFRKLDDSVGVQIAVGIDLTSPNTGETTWMPWKERTLTTQQITGSGSDLVRDAIEDMLREVRK